MHTDSQYLRQGITRWIAAWKRRGWVTIHKQPVKNRDLWTALDEQVHRHRVTWKWVRGHSGHQQNERCDRLAGEAMDRLVQRFSISELQEKLRRFQLREAERSLLPESLL